MADFNMGFPQQIGSLELWPLRWSEVSLREHRVHPYGGDLLFDELVQPKVNTIRVSNFGSEDVFIPAGWVIGAELLQVRTIDNGAFIPGGQTQEISVSCVEQGRWSAGTNPINGGRAPLTVIAAGRSINAETGKWQIDARLRQQRVWKQISKQEQRTGVRETSSLQQIMSEDSKSDQYLASVQHQFLSNVRFENEHNGYVLCVDGIPLLLEVFADEKSARQVLTATLRSLSFDISDMTPSASVKQHRIEQFIADISVVSRNESTTSVLEQLDFQQVEVSTFWDPRSRLRHMSAMNHAHHILIGV